MFRTEFGGTRPAAYQVNLSVDLFWRTGPLIQNLIRLILLGLVGSDRKAVFD